MGEDQGYMKVEAGEELWYTVPPVYAPKGTGVSVRHWVFALRLDEEDEVAKTGWVPMQLFTIPEDFAQDTIIELPCPWKIQEAFEGTGRGNWMIRQKLEEDGATPEAIEDAWRYGMACESATMGYVYTGAPEAKERMSYGHYFTWAHDGNKEWRVVVDVPKDMIRTCYPKGEKGSAAHSTHRRGGVD